MPRHCLLDATSPAHTLCPCPRHLVGPACLLVEGMGMSCSAVLHGVWPRTETFKLKSPPLPSTVFKLGSSGFFPSYIQIDSQDPQHLEKASSDPASLSVPVQFSSFLLRDCGGLPPCSHSLFPLTRLSCFEPHAFLSPNPAHPSEHLFLSNSGCDLFINK